MYTIGHMFQAKENITIASRTLPSKNVQKAYDFGLIGWTRLAFSISDAINKRNKPVSQVISALADEVRQDRTTRQEFFGLTDNLMDQLELLATGIWNLNHEKVTPKKHHTGALVERMTIKS